MNRRIPTYMHAHSIETLPLSFQKPSEQDTRNVLTKILTCVCVGARYGALWIPYRDSYIINPMVFIYPVVSHVCFQLTHSHVPQLLFQDVHSHPLLRAARNVNII